MTDDWQIHQRRPLPALLNELKELAVEELHRQLADRGHPDIRPGHGCVFRFIDPDEGSRLTDLAERSGLTKQAVGEVVGDLEELGYLERAPDPSDGRAKIVRLTARGFAGVQTAERIFADIERRWGEQVGSQKMATLRETLESVIELERSALPA
jgi:DNA-binding MarR family transcriptional regulator